MNDRPTGPELLREVERFLEQEVVPRLDGPRRYHARVAANLVAIVAREIETEEAQLHSEWERLGSLLGLREERPACAASCGTRCASAREPSRIASGAAMPTAAAGVRS